MEFEKIIGVTMNPEDSILHTGKDYREIADTIAKHLVESRGTAEVSWRPYIRQEGVFYSGSCQDITFSGKSFYPEAKPGDVVYTECMIQMEKDYEIYINLIGTVAVFLDNECIFSSLEEANKSVENDWYFSIPVKLKSDMLHRLVVKTVCTEKGFDYRLNLSPPRCASLWASFYLTSVTVLLPNAGLEKEEGIAVSPLYSGAATVEEAYTTRYAFEDEAVYAYPNTNPESNSYDFNAIYGDGKLAYLYTEACQAASLSFSAQSPAKLLVNGETLLVLQAGEEKTISLQKGDKLLIKSVRRADAWGLQVLSKDGIGLSFLDTNRKEEFSFMMCGPFYQGGLEVAAPPEYADNLLQPMPDGKQGKVFWRFQNAYLRAYHPSAFFGQWYYATMLSLLGIKQCGDALDQPEYTEYFMKAVAFLADWYDYAVYDNDTFGRAPFMCMVASSGHLDNIGTMGVNFIEAYYQTADKRYLSLIQKLRAQIRVVSRFEDGTFCRRMNNTMWADDFYMSNPFLARLYGKMGDQEALDDVLCQLNGFIERLYLPEEKIFSHIYFLDKGVKNRIPWGRGNGWIALAMSEILLQTGDIPEVEPVKKAFLEFCEGIAAVQGETGLWHQILNQPTSYLETSCTAMFSLAFFRGVANGWLPESFLAPAEKGLHAILEHCLDKNGVLYGVCMGSSCSMDPKYYFDLTTVKDDNHGTGLMLTLLCEILKMKEK